MVNSEAIAAGGQPLAWSGDPHLDFPNWLVPASVAALVITSYSIHYTKLYGSSPVSAAMLTVMNCWHGPGLCRKSRNTHSLCMVRKILPRPLQRVCRQSMASATLPHLTCIRAMNFDAIIKNSRAANRITSYNVCYTKLLCLQTPRTLLLDRLSAQ